MAALASGALTIAAADISGVWQLEQVTRALSDFADLIQLLAALGSSLEQVEPITTRLEKLFDKAGFVLKD